MRLVVPDWTMGTMIIINMMCLVQLLRFKSVKSPYLNFAPAADQQDLAPKVEDLNPNVDVFYHVYLRDSSDKDRVSKIVSEQFQFLAPSLHRNVFVTNIGAELPGIANLSDASTITIINHMATGPELISLHELWFHCWQYPDSIVAYLHSKGSFHPSKENERFRKGATMSVLSKECSKLPETCDVCGLRMNPFPHSHMPGNMFSARCSYVRNLLDPASFDKVMGEEDSTYYGRGRYAAEHWVLSHPSARACDVFGDTTYMYGYKGAPSLEELARNFSLAQAPRFPLDIVIPASGRSRRIQKQYPSFQERIDEFKRLYNQTPAQDWWGWDYFERKGNISDVFPPRLFRPRLTG